MESSFSLILFFGILIISGFLFGELANVVKLPKASGYLIAGLFLNPDLFFNLLNRDELNQLSKLPLDMALAVIAFSIGGGLHREELKSLGKSIISIGINQAEVTLLVVTFGIIGFSNLIAGFSAGWAIHLVPIAIILGALALPTDPAAFLAVKNELKAEGKITTTTLGIAAIDDMLTFLNFVIAVSIAGLFMNGNEISIQSELAHALMAIAGSIGLGIAVGVILNYVTRLVKNESSGVLIVMMIGFIFSCYGLAAAFELEKLLAAMAMGIVVVNYNPIQNKIFELLERYTDELVFVIFFTLSGLQLNFSILGDAYMLIGLFILLRFIGKWIGTVSGATLAKSDTKIKKYTTWTLLPQGGIVIGLALTLQNKPAFSDYADLIEGIVIISSILYEIIGPVTTKYALEKAGESEVKS